MKWWDYQDRSELVHEGGFYTVQRVDEGHWMIRAEGGVRQPRATWQHPFQSREEAKVEVETYFYDLGQEGTF